MFEIYGNKYLAYWHSERKGGFEKDQSTLPQQSVCLWHDDIWKEHEDHFGRLKCVAEPQFCLTVSSVYIGILLSAS